MENVQTQEEVSCLNCDAQMTPDHQCESVNTETSESDKPEVVATVETELKSDKEEKLELLEMIKKRDRLRKSKRNWRRVRSPSAGTVKRSSPLITGVGKTESL